ncbi:hypothetical protein [Saccharothrix sp. Mg75]|uniref:hypothetical protein n=1 Tax=Saccharothrix sp. Mg75 TaxID=3445357 RepID=UPI003EEFA12F
MHQAIGNAAFSRVVAVQRVVDSGLVQARTLADLKHIGADVPGFFSMSQKTKKEKFGNNKREWAEKLAAHQAALQACLVEMLSSDEVFAVGPTPDSLKNKVREYQLYRQQEERRTSAAGTPPREGELSPEVAGLYHLLRTSNRVFPLDELDRKARKADAPGTGFLFELRLAAAEIKRNERSLVQVEKLGRVLLTDHLKGSPTRYEKHRDGPVGADLVFWRPREEEDTGEKGADHGTREYDGEFVQAKSFKFSNLAHNVETATNQLAGLNASGQGRVAKDREISLLGSGHRGVIALEIWDGIADERRLAGQATKALSSAFVHLVRAVDGRDGQVYEYRK